MDKNGFVWNLNKTRCVKVSQIREFTIQQHCVNNAQFQVLAWLNANDHITVHQAESAENAREWLVMSLP